VYKNRLNAITRKNAQWTRASVQDREKFENIGSREMPMLKKGCAAESLWYCLMTTS